MNVSVNKADGCRRIVDISVPAETVREDYETIIGLFSKSVSIPGFRSGKAPDALVEKRYKKQIEQETKDRLIPRFYQEAIEKEAINPVAVIDVQDVDFSRDGGLKFKVAVDIAPDFKLPKYKKISLKRESTDVTDEDVERMLKEIMQRFARFEDVADQPVGNGDLVQIDYDAESDGKALAEDVDDARDIGSGKDFWVPIGENEFVPGVNAALEGKQIGDDVSLDVTFPEDYRIKSVAGKKATYKISVKGLRKQVLPEIDEEFLKRFEVESEEALRDRIRTDLKEANEARETGRLKDEIASFLLSKTDMDLPESLVERETYGLVRDMLTRVAQQGASQEMLKQHHEEIMGSASQSAKDRVKLTYIVDRLAEDEQIEVVDADVESRLETMSQRYGMPVDRFRAELEKQDEGLQQVRQSAKFEKVMDFLLEHAKIK
jgi:trigger factor